jgi:hypothetical protein
LITSGLVGAGVAQLVRLGLPPVIPSVRAAEARVNNGTPYNSTLLTRVDRLTGHPQNPQLHEYPVYLEINEQAGWAFAIHGPQDPRFVGKHVGEPLEPAGINPVTGQPRLSPATHKPAIPLIHTIVLEWRGVPLSTSKPYPGFFHLEGGILVHAVDITEDVNPLNGRGETWYVKGWYGRGVAADKPIVKSLHVQGKIVFLPVTAQLGGQAELVAIAASNYPATGDPVVKGGPSTIGIRQGGHPDYPPFKSISMIVRNARYNSGLYAEIPHNRYGFPTRHDTSWARPDGAYAVDPLTGTYGKGDELPDADLPGLSSH